MLPCSHRFTTAATCCKKFAKTSYEGIKHKKRAGLIPRPSASRSKALTLGVVGPYLAVDLLDEGFAVLVVLLELTHLLELLGGKALDPPGNLCDGQLIVVCGLQRSQHARA